MSKDLLVVLVLLLGAAQCQAAEITCLRDTNVEIRELYGKFRFVGDKKPQQTISLHMVVDCKSGKTLKPSTEMQAIDWIDMTLPLDFKRAALYGEYVNVPRYGLYGASVEEDVSRVLTAAWGLRDDNSFCKEIKNTSSTIKPESSCFYKLLYRLRELYKAPISTK